MKYDKITNLTLYQIVPEKKRIIQPPPCRGTFFGSMSAEDIKVESRRARPE